jgi:hypothetical protein
MRAAAVFFLSALAAVAAVDGVVKNASTGKAQPGATVSLIGAGAQGMTTLGTTQTAADGKFSFNVNADQPMLLQGSHQGVNYSLMVAPGAPSTGLTLNVFDLSADQKIAKVTQHMVLLQPTGTDLQVAETFLVANQSSFTLSDAKNGSIRFSVPEGAKPEVTISGPGGVPLQRPAEKMPQPGVYKVGYPVKPGETRFDITYTLPWKQPLEFAGKSLMNAEAVRLIAPPGVTLAGDGVEPLGQEPTTQASIYQVKSASYKVEIAGTGTLRAPEQQAEGGAEGPGIQQILPRLYDRLLWIVGLALAILAAGGALLFRKQAS